MAAASPSPYLFPECRVSSQGIQIPMDSTSQIIQCESSSATYCLPSVESVIGCPAENGLSSRSASVSSNLREVSIQEDNNSGYNSDDESSDCDDITSEPVDSGRTRSSKRKAANQKSEKQEESDTSRDTSTNNENNDDAKGRKRKKKQVGGGSGSESEGESNDRRRVKIDADNVHNNEPVCSCPRNVMTCIGILPSLPIVSHFYDSSDTDQSLEDSFPILPTVSRPSRRGGEHE